MDNVRELRTNMWVIEDREVRFFVLKGTWKSVLIDTGLHRTDAKELAESLTGQEVFLINTHADPDHINGNGSFTDVFMSPKEMPDYRRIHPQQQTLHPLTEGDILDLGGLTLEVIDMPGHTPGSLAVLAREERILISGDPIQKHGTLYVFGKQRSPENYISSLLHLEKWKGQFDEVWPSHADIPVSPEMIPILAEDMQNVIGGRVEGYDTQMGGTDITAYKVRNNTFLMDYHFGDR